MPDGQEIRLVQFIQNIKQVLLILLTLELDGLANGSVNTTVVVHH
jgi:hypothetical protein